MGKCLFCMAIQMFTEVWRMTVEQGVETAVDSGALELGARIRKFRKMRRLSLRELGGTVQVSAGFLSQLERGEANASVSTLRRIAGALGLAVADLFEGTERNHAQVHRKGDRPKLKAADGMTKYLLSRPPLHHIEVYQADFVPGASTGARALRHGSSQEFLVVMHGDVELELGDKRFALHEGDSIEYESSTPHRVVNTGDDDAAVLWIISPPDHERQLSGGGIDNHTNGRSQ
ncbi:XRE family transcriptional regulator [Aeromicrobium sp.]|uniref:helix-turn-helix domain-containing protein n=1 Tax=Aeromicrobium sp. TaxID=1871063 RepID=UPI0030C185F8